MVYSWPWPSMTVLLEEQIKDMRMVQNLRSEASVGDVIVVVVRSKKSIVSLHLVVNGNRAIVFYPQPHCVLVQLLSNLLCLLPFLTFVTILQLHRQHGEVGDIRQHRLGCHYILLISIYLEAINF